MNGREQKLNFCSGEMFEKLGKSLDVEMKTSAQNNLAEFKAKNCSNFGKW